MESQTVDWEVRGQLNGERSSRTWAGAREAVLASDPAQRPRQHPYQALVRKVRLALIAMKRPQTRKMTLFRIDNLLRRLEAFRISYVAAKPLPIQRLDYARPLPIGPTGPDLPYISIATRHPKGVEALAGQYQRHETQMVFLPRGFYWHRLDAGHTTFEAAAAAVAAALMSDMDWTAGAVHAPNGTRLLCYVPNHYRTRRRASAAVPHPSDLHSFRPTPPRYLMRPGGGGGGAALSSSNPDPRRANSDRARPPAKAHLATGAVSGPESGAGPAAAPALGVPGAGVPPIQLKAVKGMKGRSAEVEVVSGKLSWKR